MEQNIDINETLGMGQISLPITDSPITDNASGNTVSDNKLDADVSVNATANTTANTNATVGSDNQLTASDNNVNVSDNKLNVLSDNQVDLLSKIGSNNKIDNKIDNKIELINKTEINNKIDLVNKMGSDNNMFNNNQINLIINPPDLQITEEHIKQIMKDIYAVLGQHKLDLSNYLETAASVYHTAASMKDIPVRLRGNAVINALQNIAELQKIDPALIKIMVDNVPRVVNILDDAKHEFIKLKNSSCCIIC